TDQAGRILTDGGGIRGYSSLLILEEICKQVEKAEAWHDGLEHSWGDQTPEHRPCDYFNYIVGTSVGGFEAIMLGRLQMKIEDCLLEFRRLGQDVFGKRRALKWNQYSHEKLEAVISRVVDDYCRDGRRGSPLRMNHPTVDEAYMFRSYPCMGNERPKIDNTRVLNAGDNGPVYIGQAARATSAAPHYFREALINGSRFIDGGVTTNNPSRRAYWEAKYMHRQRKHGADGPAIGAIISIGTGKSAPLSMFSRSSFAASWMQVVDIVRVAFKALTDPEPVHKEMERMMEDQGVPYFRFNVEKGLEDVKLDEFK
ncbi:FabD/lysophospholipase-like protein, partial [Aulographum hederae CBS 113979]